MQTIHVPSRRSVVLGFLAVMGAGIAIGGKLMASAPADIDVSLEEVSASGRYQVLIVPEVKLVKVGKIHVRTVSIHSTETGRPVAGAQIVAAD